MVAPFTIRILQIHLLQVFGDVDGLPVGKGTFWAVRIPLINILNTNKNCFIIMIVITKNLFTNNHFGKERLEARFDYIN